METEIPISATDTSGGRPDIRSRSSQASGLRDELSNLKNDLDALMLHASTLSESDSICADSWHCEALQSKTVANS